MLVDEANPEPPTTRAPTAPPHLPVPTPSIFIYGGVNYHYTGAGQPTSPVSSAGPPSPGAVLDSWLCLPLPRRSTTTAECYMGVWGGCMFVQYVDYT